MKLSNPGPIPVYTVAGANVTRSLPDWLAQKKTKNLKKDPEYANRVELLQDFEFEEASQCVRISEDGQWLMSTGTYKPQIHTHYLPNLSLSYDRHTNTLNKTFVLLSADYTKSVHLQEDRSIEFHHPGGCHYALRIPRYGCDLVYNRSSAEVLVPSVGNNANGSGSVFRINLELGRFMPEYEIQLGNGRQSPKAKGVLQGALGSESVNTAAVAEVSHGLLAFGTSIGTVEFWDARVGHRVTILNIPSEPEGKSEVTALDFHMSGLNIAVGTSDGLTYLYDMRSSSPTIRRDQGFGFPIKHVQYLTTSSSSRESAAAVMEPKVLSADKRILKIWDERTGDPWTSVEPSVDINSIAWFPDSGMVLTANEGKQQHAFFIPQLGPAPRWCSFLDNIVEEMADNPNDPNAYSTSGHKAGEVYDNYKFLTEEQLGKFDLLHLLGEKTKLKAYMHGYFVPQHIYEEARIKADLTSWEDERTKQVQKRIEKQRESRIRGNKKPGVKINPKIAQRAVEAEELNERRKARLLERGEVPRNDQEPEDSNDEDRTDKSGGGLLSDPRFATLFEEEDFAVDETSRAFQEHNPSTRVEGNVQSTNNNVSSNRENRLTAVEEELFDDVPRSSDDEDDDNDNDNDYDLNDSTNNFTTNTPKTQNLQKKNNEVSLADYRRTPNKKQKARELKASTEISTATKALQRERWKRWERCRRDAYGRFVIHHMYGGGNSRTGRPAKADRSFGSRAERLNSGNGDSRSTLHKTNDGGGGRSGRVVGGKSASFGPGTSGQRKQQQGQHKAEGASGMPKERRSASVKVFRNL